MASLHVRLAFRHEVWLLEEEGSQVRSWWLHQAALSNQVILPGASRSSSLPPTLLLGNCFSAGSNTSPFSLWKQSLECRYPSPDWHLGDSARHNPPSPPQWLFCLPSDLALPSIPKTEAHFSHRACYRGKSHKNQYSPAFLQVCYFLRI